MRGRVRARPRRRIDMRKLLLALAGVFMLSAASAQYVEYEPIYFSIVDVKTSAVGIYDSATSSPLHGKVIAVSCSVESNMSMSLTTVADTGLSLGKARTVMAARAIVADDQLYTNIAETIYLWGDKVVCNVGLAVGATNKDLKAIILLDK